MRATSARTLLWEDISFMLTNRIPHRVANRFFGWFSRIEAPLLTLGKQLTAFPSAPLEQKVSDQQQLRADDNQRHQNG